MNYLWKYWINIQNFGRKSIIWMHFPKEFLNTNYDFLLEKQRTNKHISKLMVCSEEHIRKNLQNTIEKIVEDNKNEYNIL